MTNPTLDALYSLDSPPPEAPNMPTVATVLSRCEVEFHMGVPHLSCCCGETICELEAGDTMSVLAALAIGHQAHAHMTATQTTTYTDDWILE